MQVLDVVSSAFAWFLIIVFILLNLAITMGRMFSSKFINHLKKTFNIEIPDEPNKKSFLYTIHWIILGIIFAVIPLYDSVANSLIVTASTIISAIVAFMTYRSGANLGYTLIAWKHDLRIIKEQTKDNTILSIISKAVKLGVTLSVMFAVVWSIFYKLIRFNINLAFGTDPSIFTLLVWIIGIVLGLSISFIVLRNYHGIALKNEIGIVSLFAIKQKPKEIHEKAEDTAKKVLGKAGDLLGI